LADDFAAQGLRVLAFGTRNTGEDVDIETTEQIECNLNLLGITAVEDLLQDDVAKCIEEFRIAGIKVWMLTGDKGETAKEIGKSCGLYDEKTMKLIEVTESLD
jgi:magnesium-transporting ATPase (P-type)